METFQETVDNICHLYDVQIITYQRAYDQLVELGFTERAILKLIGKIDGY